MKEILDLIETVNQNLKQKNLLPTPSNYEEEFFKLVKTTDILLEDYIEFEEILEDLSEKERNSVRTFKDIAVLLDKRIQQTEIKQFLKHLSFYMSPSIANEDVKDEIYKACSELAQSPKDLISIENIRKLRKITNSRIYSDKFLFNEKANDVKKLIVFLDKYFTKILNEHTTTIDAISEIKNEIVEIDLSIESKKELELLQDRLIGIASQIEDSMKNSYCNLDLEYSKCTSLHEQIQELQENLSKAEEEKSIDFLTGILTRRAYELEVKRVENEFKVFDSNYALVFFDIDHFKDINDNYGHDCGDQVLGTFAKILKKLTRTEDIIARYGGEEFVALVHYKNIMEVKNYLSRAKNIITNNKFKYKDLKLQVKFSAGVAFRKNYDSYKDTIKKADELLYEAKNSGRNKIILDNSDVL